VNVYSSKAGRPARRVAAVALASAALVFLLQVSVASPLFGQDGAPGTVDAGGRGGKAPELAEETGGDFGFEQELSEYIAMPETLMYKMRAGEKGFVVVDLRAPDRFSGGHLRGAVNYPWKGGYFLSAFGDLPMNGDIFLMSEDGGFGLDALRILLSAGFGRVYNIEGGMRNWPYADLVEGR
jgi:rhodanese-related sulfurtransferase